MSKYKFENHQIELYPEHTSLFSLILSKYDIKVDKVGLASQNRHYIEFSTSGEIFENIKNEAGFTIFSVRKNS